MFDGINECSGRIIIMTSNKPEVLDKALIRPGRIDIKIHFQKCTSYDIMCLINLFWENFFMAGTGRIPLWIIVLVGGLAVIAMLAIFIYGSYSGLGSSV